MTAMPAADQFVSRLLAECAHADSVDTPAIAETLLALTKVLYRRAKAAAGEESTIFAAAIGDALESHGVLSEGSSCFRLWTPAIAETTRHIERGEGTAALYQLALMLDDAGFIVDAIPPAGTIDRLWRGGRFFGLDASGSEIPVGTSQHWVALPNMCDKFLLPTREVILDNADVEVVWPAPEDHGVSEILIADAGEAIAEAARWISEISTLHLAWVDRLICGFAITEMPVDSELSSGSYKSRPGVVHMSFPLDPVLVAETLIHEASHQHYLLLNGVVPMVEAGANDVVFSPIKGCDRPVVRCAFAHHACFNIWDFMRRGVGSRYGAQARERMELMAGYTEVLGRNISDSGTLTGAGARFVHALQSRIFLPEAA